MVDALNYGVFESDVMRVRLF